MAEVAALCSVENGLGSRSISAGAATFALTATLRHHIVLLVCKCAASAS